MATSLPPQSALQQTITQPLPANHPLPTPTLAYNLSTAQTVLHNLRYQHSWTHLQIHTQNPKTSLPLSRPLISGLPPSRIYIHPSEQAALLRAGKKEGQNAGRKEAAVRAEREWVLPTCVEECISVEGFVKIFDGIGIVPPRSVEEEEEDMEEGGDEDKEVGWEWRGENRRKRILLSTLHADSTVVYYIMHDGIVKPRQN